VSRSSPATPSRRERSAERLRARSPAWPGA